AGPLDHSIAVRAGLAPDVRSTKQALLTSVGLSALFLIVYGGCNWITTRRGDVGKLYFRWERNIPFLRFMILPYLSIDLLFVGAPFLFRTTHELRLLWARIAFVIVIAGVCFLLFPLRFAFDRPPATGWLGMIFDWFRGVDAPHNLAPSLHATLMLILLDVYLRHNRGMIRTLLIIWFVAIGLSPVLTYQHHVIDIVTGFILGGCSFYLFRDDRFFSLRQPNESHNQAPQL
ncbi:MAG TPA: hypothetical protein VJ721_08465, partial [Chthoniobacterales bacterium]|nr:hypothetical protein [Chthoniobacterales bacterium]